MNRYLRTVFSLILTFTGMWAVASTPIRGTQEADVERMYQFVAARNPAFTREIAEAFHEVGKIYGVRGDIALCQAIIETGWFRFDNGTAVHPSAHNYCGLGVHSRGEKGCSFSSVRDGVTAMIQHLYAYSCKDRIPEGESMLDPRFGFVNRGCAENWESLSGKWSMNDSYGDKILALYRSMLRHEVKPLNIQYIEVKIPGNALCEAHDEDAEHDAEDHPFFK